MPVLIPRDGRRQALGPRDARPRRTEVERAGPFVERLVRVVAESCELADHQRLAHSIAEVLGPEQRVISERAVGRQLDVADADDPVLEGHGAPAKPAEDVGRAHHAGVRALAEGVERLPVRIHEQVHERNLKRVGRTNERLDPRRERRVVDRPRVHRALRPLGGVVEVDRVIDRGLVHLAQGQRKEAMPAPGGQAVQRALLPGDRARREDAVGGLVVVQGDAELLEVVRARGAPGGLAGRLHRRQGERDQDRDDRDRDQQLDQGKPTPQSRLARHRSTSLPLESPHPRFLLWVTAIYLGARGGKTQGATGFRRLEAVCGTNARCPRAPGRDRPGCAGGCRDPG